MKRHHTLVLLLLASVAAGLWLFKPSKLAVEPVTETAGSCDQDSACSTVAASRDGTETEPAPPAGPEPAPSAAPGEGAAAVAAAVPAPKPTPMPASPASGEELREEGERLLAAGKSREGLEALRKAVEADPSAQTYGDVGALLERLTVFDEAARYLQHAAELDPGNADRWIALANAYYRKAEPGEAWKAERRAREAEPGLVLGRDSNGMRIRRPESQGDSAAGKQ